MMCRKTYIDSPHGQIHVREWPAQAELKPPLVCLHPAPWSGLYFADFAPLLTHNRRVIALDYPGYGGSDRVAGFAPTISTYAQACQAVIEQLCVSGPADILGFHTGCLVAAETAIHAPALVGRLVLVDIPYFEAKDRAGMLASIKPDAPITENLSSVEEMWSFSVSKRLEDMPLSKAFALFLEHARAGERRSAAFRAAFSYPCEERFGMIAHPTWVVATTSGLRQATLLARERVKGAHFIDLADITTSVFGKNAGAMARDIDALF